MEDDLPLLVSVNIFNEHFTCSICMNTMKETFMTNCGHRFCGHCIKEWVGRKHKCPCCNKPLNVEDLFRDHQFDSLIDTVHMEKNKSETQYFESLINSAVTVNSDKNLDTMLSPVEKVLKEKEHDYNITQGDINTEEDHLKESLAAHEKYFQTLKKQQTEKIKILEHSCEEAVNELGSHGLSEQELTQQTEDLKNRLSRQKDDVQHELDLCTQLIVEAYNKYLTNHIPKLDVLPVKATVSILTKDLKISDVVFQPSDSIGSKVVTAVEATMKARNNPVVAWPSDLHFVLFGPFAKCSHFEMQQIVTDVLHHGKTFPDVQVLDKTSKPVLQYSMKPGSEIAIYGNVKLESDMPKRCFAQLFKTNEQQAVDYFICKQCKFQWICRSCMETCHNGHDTAPYIMNHQPAWACCYCPKKKTCRIQNIV